MPRFLVLFSRVMFAYCLVMLASCLVGAPRPMAVSVPVIPPPVARPAFVGRLVVPGESLPAGRTNVYLLAADGSAMLVAYFVNDGGLFGPPHAAGDTGIFWTVERDPNGMRHWRAAGNLAWIISHTLGDGVPWRVGPP